MRVNKGDHLDEQIDSKCPQVKGLAFLQSFLWMADTYLCKDGKGFNSQW